MPASFRLLTNIQLVQIGTPVPITLHCNALLLESSLGANAEPLTTGQIRGFMTDGSLPVFTHKLRCGPLEYEAAAATNPNFVVSKSHDVKPLFTGQILTFGDGTTLSIVTEDQRVDLEVTDHDNISEVWKKLPIRVLKHWSTPNFPVCHWVPTASVVDILKRQVA